MLELSDAPTIIIVTIAIILMNILIFMFVKMVKNEKVRISHKFNVITLSDIRAKWDTFSHITTEPFDKVFVDFFDTGKDYIIFHNDFIKFRTKLMHQVVYDIMKRENIERMLILDA